ncbi:MAG: serine/threonine protein kinase [Pirellulaceae bacterium]|nr:serine/threonine protein kinase [Pirellulaceae bacterium]
MGLLDRFQSMFQGTKKVDVSDRFELLREAVSGTMSSFYMARDRRDGRIVGLKVGDREKVTAFEARFKGLKKPSEGEIASSFKHPLIVETYEYGTTSEGVPYIVMEYLSGPGLQTLVHNNDPLLEGRRLLLVRQMAEALEVVHKAGYIHRDVCPRNFIVSPDGEALKLIDFGLTVPATREFMQPGNRTGTPLYMSPEVVRRRWTDQRLDVFSFGVTAYHVCACQLPWPSGDATGQAALTHDTLPPIEILEFRPTLNRKLGRLIMRCMKANPNDRPQTMEQVVRDLRQIAGDDE